MKLNDGFIGFGRITIGFGTDCRRQHDFMKAPITGL